MSSGACLSLFVNVYLLKLFLTFLFSLEQDRSEDVHGCVRDNSVVACGFFFMCMKYEPYPLN